MSDERIDCPAIDIRSEICIGNYANAFRVLRDTGSEYFLDFIVYSATEKRGVVIARIRVNVSFLEGIRDRLTNVLSELTSPLSEEIVWTAKKPSEPS